MNRIVPILIAYLAFMGVGATLSASTTLHSAPAAAPIGIDSLPQGRHQVSSYRNGSSTEFIVEHGAIQELKIDGVEIDPSEYDRYENRVEDMLGMKRRTMRNESYSYDVIRDYDNLSGDVERLEEYFERHGEKWERIGEELAERVEKMFDFDRDGSTYRFYFDGHDNDAAMEFNLDSIMMETNPDLREFDVEEMMEEKERSRQTARDEIEELETMIERMERRKAEAEKRLMEDGAGGAPGTGFNFEYELKNLRSEGMIDPGVIRSYKFSHDKLVVNGKKASEAAHQLFLSRYRERVNIGGKFTIEMDGLEL